MTDPFTRYLNGPTQRQTITKDKKGVPSFVQSQHSLLINKIFTFVNHQLIFPDIFIAQSGNTKTFTTLYGFAFLSHSNCVWIGPSLHPFTLTLFSFIARLSSVYLIHLTRRTCVYKYTCTYIYIPQKMTNIAAMRWKRQSFGYVSEKESVSFECQLMPDPEMETLFTMGVCKLLCLISYVYSTYIHVYINI